MSFTAEGWAWEQRCPSSASKSVLVCLGWHANKDGERAIPSIATICRLTQLAENTVRKALGDLIKAALVERHERMVGKRCLTAEYRLAIRETPPSNLGGVDTSVDEGDPSQICVPPPSNLRPPPPNSEGESKTLNQEDNQGVQQRPRARACAKAVSMPVDWEPTDEDRAYAIEHGRNPDLCRDDVREYWVENGGKRPGWSRTYRQYVRRCESRNEYPLQPILRLFSKAPKPTLHEEWNLPTFAAPVFTDEEPDAEPVARRIAQ
jgi:hypothetical protein